MIEEEGELTTPGNKRETRFAPKPVAPTKNPNVIKPDRKLNPKKLEELYQNKPTDEADKAVEDELDENINEVTDYNPDKLYSLDCDNKANRDNIDGLISGIRAILSIMTLRPIETKVRYHRVLLKLLRWKDECKSTPVVTDPFKKDYEKVKFDKPKSKVRIYEWFKPTNYTDKAAPPPCRQEMQDWMDMDGDVISVSPVWNKKTKKWVCMTKTPTLDPYWNLNTLTTKIPIRKIKFLKDWITTIDFYRDMMDNDVVRSWSAGTYTKTSDHTPGGPRIMPYRFCWEQGYAYWDKYKALHSTSTEHSIRRWDQDFDWWFTSYHSNYHTSGRFRKVMRDRGYTFEEGIIRRASRTDTRKFTYKEMEDNAIAANDQTSSCERFPASRKLRKKYSNNPCYREGFDPDDHEEVPEEPGADEPDDDKPHEVTHKITGNIGVITYTTYIGPDDIVTPISLTDDQKKKIHMVARLHMLLESYVQDMHNWYKLKEYSPLQWWPLEYSVISPFVSGERSVVSTWAWLGDPRQSNGALAKNKDGNYYQDEHGEWVTQKPIPFQWIKMRIQVSGPIMRHKHFAVIDKPKDFPQEELYMEYYNSLVSNNAFNKVVDL